MSKLSDYLEPELLNHILRNTAYVSPAAIYVALYTTDPTDADVGAEVAAPLNYARQVVVFNAPVVDGIGYSCANNANVVFPVATAAWGLVGWVGLRDALAAGNLLFHGPVTASKNVQIGDQLIIATGTLKAILE